MIAPAPRRYSTFDPGYSQEIGERVRVTVDGDLFRCVVAYDCDEGWLETLAHDYYGVSEIVKGEVRVRRYHGKIDAVLI